MLALQRCQSAMLAPVALGGTPLFDRARRFGSQSTLLDRLFSRGDALRRLGIELLRHRRRSPDMTQRNHLHRPPNRTLQQLDRVADAHGARRLGNLAC